MDIDHGVGVEERSVGITADVTKRGGERGVAQWAPWALE